MSLWVLDHAVCSVFYDYQLEAMAQSHVADTAVAAAAAASADSDERLPKSLSALEICCHGTYMCLLLFAGRTKDWIEQGLTSHSTHFRSFRRLWDDCGISQDCSRSQSPQCVQYWVVCARPLLITVVCMCIIWKALCPYVLDARLGLWVCRPDELHLVI